jgi:hypothetical protein
MNAIKIPVGSSHLHFDGDEGDEGEAGEGDEGEAGEAGEGEPDFLGGPDPAVIGEAAPLPRRTCSLGPKHSRQSPGSSGKRANHARQPRARTGMARLAGTRLAMVSS